MSEIRLKPRKMVSSIRRGTSSTRSRRRNVLMLLLCCLCSLWNICESFTLPYIKRSGVSIEELRRTWLKSTETESPPEIRAYAAPRESSYLTTLAQEALIMASGDGAVEESDDDDDVEQNGEAEQSREDEGEPTEEEDDEQLKRQTAAAAAALLRRKSGGVRAVKPLRNKSTSVGTRRVGSASRARASQRGTSKILDTVRTVAAAAAADTNSTTAKSSDTKKNSTSSKSVNIGNSMIQATISSLLEGQKKSDDDSSGMSMSAYPRQFGILGDAPDPLSHELLRNPMPGTVLLYPTIQAREYQRPSRETLSVRLATPDDDFQISNLRLSVFSDFSSELRSQFCARSCQVLADRRLRGATCLVATCPSGRNNPSEIVVGSVECSVHEFHATKLGQRRPKYSTLYITEVAVSPSARRCGVGSKLLQVLHVLTVCLAVP